MRGYTGNKQIANVNTGQKKDRSVSQSGCMQKRGFSCSFPMISHERSTRDVALSATIYGSIADVKVLTDQMVTLTTTTILTAKIDNINNNRRKKN